MSIWIYFRQRATAMAHDVSKYCVANGSPVYICSLDAEIAFDGIPHDVLLLKAMNVLSGPSWNLLYYWYSNMSIRIKWDNHIGRIIPVERGTKQGGISSPRVFYLFYEEMVNQLNSMDCGIKIGNRNYSTFCYADDLLICSLTVSGLQNMIDAAVSYIESHCLEFNAAKTNCMIYGKSFLKTAPSWTISGEELSIKQSIVYLGTVLDGSGNQKGLTYVESRINASRKAYYALQGSGLHKNGVSARTAINIYKAAIQSTLSFGCQSIKLSIRSRNSLDKHQTKLLKTIFGVNPYNSHTRSFLEAIFMNKLSHVIDIQSLDLLSECLMSYSNSRSFYSFMFNDSSDNPDNTLVGRMKIFAKKENFNMCNYIFSDTYRKVVKRKLLHKVAHGVNGYVDCLQYLLSRGTVYNRNLLQLLLKVF